MRNNLHIYEAREKEMAAQIGIALTAWANFEQMLFLISCWALQIEREKAASVVAHFLTFRNQLDFTDRLMRVRLENSPALQSWISLYNYCCELSGERNFIAHTPIVAHAKGPPDKADYAEASPILGPSVRSGLGIKDKRDPMDIHEVRELELDFSHCAKFAADLCNALLLGGPSLENFREPVARRRPSLSERRDEKGKKPPTQRPPSQA